MTTQYRARVTAPWTRDCYEVIVIRDEFEVGEDGNPIPGTVHQYLMDSEGNWTEFQPYELLDNPTWMIPGLVAINVPMLQKALQGLVEITMAQDKEVARSIVRTFMREVDEAVS